MVISTPAARRARPRPAGGDGGTADLPVGQGLLRRRRLPEDRPARARDALRGRGLRRPDRARCAASRSTSRGSRSTTRRSTRRSSAPTPSATSRSRAARRCRACCARGPENLDDLTIQVALVRPGPIQGGAVHPYIERRQQLREDPAFVPPVDHPSLARAAARDARRRRLPGSGARGGDGARRLHRRRGGGAAARDEPQAERTRRSRRYRARFVEGALGKGVDAETRGPRLRQARRLLGLRLPEVALRPRSRCSPTSRRGCATTTRPSSSARS